MFYGEKLYTIREMFSYTREDLAKKLQVDEQLLWKIETNQMNHYLKLINEMKIFFNVQTSYFFEKPYVNAVSDTGKIAFRKSIGDKREGIHAENTFLDYFFTHISDIEQIVYPVLGSFNSYCHRVERKYNLTQLTHEDIKNIAEEAREALNIVSNNRLMYSLEISGLYIVERKLENTIDAYSTWLLEDSYPVIVLNSGKNSAVRRNFDMGHELGHLILHQYVDFDEINADRLKELESEANLFSSYFMLPEEELKSDFLKIGNPTEPDAYIPLKENYKMSIQSIAYRANKEGWMTKEENRLFWKNINKQRYRKFEPLDDKLPIHIPGKIRSLIYNALKVNESFITDWLEKYSVDIKYFEYIFNIKDDFLSSNIIQPSGYHQTQNVLKLHNHWK